MDPAIADLDNQSMTWLIVAAAGFFVGVSFITGPLAWFYGSRLRNRYRERGLVPNQQATIAWVLGIASTALYAIVMVFVALMVMAVVGAAATS